MVFWDDRECVGIEWMGGDFGNMDKIVIWGEIITKDRRRTFHYSLNR